MTRRFLPLFFFLAVATPISAWGQATVAPGGESGIAATASGEDADERSPEAKLAKKYPFRGSTFLWLQSLNALALDRGAELTYNPNYSWLFRLQPRYYVTDHLNFRLRIGLSVEWTNADDTTYYHQPLWEDIWADAVYSNLVKIPVVGINVSPSVRFVLPASKASQARSLYFGVGPGVALTRGVKLPKGMSLDFAYSFGYIKNINHYSTLQYDAPTIVTCNGTGGGDCGQFLHSGGRNASHVFTNMFLADWTITKRWKFGALFAVLNSLLYPLTPGSVTTAGGGVVNVPADPNFNVDLRASMIYSFDLTFEAHPAISIALSSWTYNPQLSESSTYRAPFFNRYTELNLITTINLDRLVAGIHHRVKPTAQ